MKRGFALTALVIPALAALLAVERQNTHSVQPTLATRSASPNCRPNDHRRAQAAQNYGRIPLHFEKNVGQTDRRVQFLARGGGYGLSLTSTGALLSLRMPEKKSAQAVPARTNRSPRCATVALKLVGANPHAEVQGAGELPGKVNYFLGRDPKKWRTNVPTYAKVRYEQVYPGIDLVYYGNQRQLEYDFVVAPGADPGVIGLEIEGAERVNLAENGDMALRVAGGEVRQHRPVVYQEVNGERREVAGRYILRTPEHRIGFEVAQYDPIRPLIIDPVLSYSTYLGGSSMEYGYAIAVDSSGGVYVAGYTQSSDFPVTAGAFDTTKGGVTEAYVTKVQF